MLEKSIGKKGVVESGDSKGTWVWIQDDRSNTGGFLILKSPDSKFEAGSDDWVENLQALEKYISERNWKIRWQK